MNEIITVAKQSNRDFLKEHAGPGRVGLAGGATLIEKPSQTRRNHVVLGATHQTHKL
jgi:hypothetical protein